MPDHDPFTRMSAIDAKQSLPKISSELHKLSPDSIVVLYEIDIHEIESNMSLKQSVQIEGDILRFHNMEVLRGQKLVFNQETYYSMPIIVEGFEMTSSGELPRPKLTLPSMQGLRDKEEEQ